MRFVVVAGTDTGVGKTFVTVALTRALVADQRKPRVLAVKPIESGCAETVSDDEDGVRLARASGQAGPRAALQRLRAAVTPALAADLEGAKIDVPSLLGDVRALARDATADVVIVEGAGGLLSPISWTHDILDVAAELEAPILLVGADRLGVLHHVRAAATVLAARRHPLLGVVLSAPEVPDASTGTNVEALARFGIAPDRMARFDRLAGDDPTVVATAIRSVAASAMAVADWVLHLP